MSATNVVIKFNVDAAGAVSGAKRVEVALEGIEGKSKSTGKAVSDAFSMDGAIEKMKRAGDFFSGIMGKLTSSVNDLIEHERLAMGSSAANMDRLKKASGGLRTQLDLMRDASKLMGGEFKVGQYQMEQIEGAMRSLISRGKEQSKVTEAITQAVTKLSTEGLQELGITVKTAGLSMDDAADKGEKYKRIMAAISEESQKVAGHQETQAEKAMKAGVAMQDASDKMKKAFGEIAAALLPIVMMIKDFVKDVAKLPKQGATVLKSGLQGAEESGAFGFGMNVLGLGGAVPKPSDVWHDWDGNGSYQDMWTGQIANSQRVRGARLSGDANRQYEEQYVQYGKTMGKGFVDMLGSAFGKDRVARALNDVANAQGVNLAHKGKGERDKLASDAEAARKKKIEDQITDDEFTRKQQGQAESLDEWLTGVDADKRRADLEKWKEDYAATNALVDDYKKLQREMYPEGRDRAESKAFLERIFGPIDDFNKYREAFSSMGIALSSLGKATEIFGNASGAAFGAWIDGSMSAGAAFKKSIGEQLKATAVSLMGTGVKEGVMALVSLAGQDYRGAALHGKASAAAFAGAAAVGVLAKAVGGGGAPAAGAGGGGAGAASPPSGGYKPIEEERSGKHVVQIIGDPFDTETNPRIRQRNARRLFKAQIGSMGGQEA